MNRIIAAIIFAAVVTTATASPLPDYPFVFVSGSADVKLPPDTCQISLQITVRDKNSTNGLQTVETRSAEVLALLAKNEVKKEDIVAYEISKDILRDKEKQDHFEFLGYEITRRMEFTLHDLKQYEPIMAALLTLPDVTDTMTSFDRTDRKTVEARLTTQAVADARAKAELLAQAAGQRIAKLRAISQNDFDNLAAEFGLGENEHRRPTMLTPLPSGSQLLFIPTTIEFEDSVSILYEITEQK